MYHSCRFCPELRGDLSNSEFHNLMGHDFGSRFIRESANFVIFPTVGQIVPGYLLIVPKTHHLSMGYLPIELFDELEEVIHQTYSQLRLAYDCKPIFFEHGPLSITKKGGCCVDHAHIHAIPANVDLRQDINKLYPEQEISYLHELRDIVQMGSPYLFFQNTDRRKFVYESHTVVSQFLRQILAKNIGVPERWDWRVKPGKAYIKDTLETLKDWNNVNSVLDFSQTLNSLASCDTGV